MGFPAWVRTLSALIAPVVIKNPGADSTPFRVRNTADSADALSVTSGGTVTASVYQASAGNEESFRATGSTGGIRFGGTPNTTYLRRWGTNAISSDSMIGVRAMTTGARPAANAVPAGMFYFDTTLGKPVWSDATNWRDAAGTIV